MNCFHNDRKLQIATVGASLVLFSQLISMGIGPCVLEPVYAAKTPATQSSTAGGSAIADPFMELKLLEKRFFVHSYEHDPPEKRLQRLELLVFGATQPGTNNDRFKRLKAAVAQNDKEAAKAIRERSRSTENNTRAENSPQLEEAANKQPAPSSPSKKSASPNSSEQYPVLNTLEWRVLKKTFGKESLDQRLDRLETSLFGQPSVAMSYVDRIERLKKIIGIATADDAANEGPGSRRILPPGPLPRGYGGRRLMVTPYEGSQSTPLVTPLPGRSFEEDYMSRMDSDLPNIINQMNRHMDQMMKEMMEDMKKPGSSSPYGSPYMIPIPSKEKKEKEKEKPKIPPYADPNSI